MKLLSDAVWEAIQAELEAKREDVRRLTEALARKNDVPLYMPQTPIGELQHALEHSSGWFDTKPVVVIPPKPLGEKQ